MSDLTVNGRSVHIDVEPDTPLLWVIRDEIGLKGTKFGCGIGICGACTVMINGEAVRSCAMPVSAVKGEITTIEGLSSDMSHPVQKAWLEFDVPQCGYCQPGQMMSCTALLKAKANPSDEDINAAMTNLCRCGTYGRIRRAVHRAAELSNAAPAPATTPAAPAAEGGAK